MADKMSDHPKGFSEKKACQSFAAIFLTDEVASYVYN
jgi:hypothetical protein